MAQKVGRHDNPKHLKFIRTLQCCVCNRSGSQACHIRAGTDGGMGRKPSDWWVVPMCFECHHRQHNGWGEKDFWGDDLDRAKRLSQDLYALTGKTDQAVFRVFKFQRGE